MFSEICELRIVKLIFVSNRGYCVTIFQIFCATSASLKIVTRIFPSFSREIFSQVRCLKSQMHLSEKQLMDYNVCYNIYQELHHLEVKLGFHCSH